MLKLLSEALKEIVVLCNTKYDKIIWVTHDKLYAKQPMRRNHW